MEQGVQGRAGSARQSRECIIEKGVQDRAGSVQGVQDSMECIIEKEECKTRERSAR